MTGKDVLTTGRTRHLIQPDSCDYRPSDEWYKVTAFYHTGKYVHAKKDNTLIINRFMRT